MLSRKPANRKNRLPGARSPRIYLHIGEPKTGTTYLQDALWANRSRLAARGVLLPGFGYRDHSRASRDLRETRRPAADPAEPWIGEWDVLAGEALRAPEIAVISNELLAACGPGQADRAVQSLLPAEVHVVATVRDLAGLLPAEWQEMVKCRGTVPWEEWLDSVIGVTADPDRRRLSWFWRVHDTLAILEMWSRHIPPDQVHVITVPPPGRADELWLRFASVLGIDPAGIDFSQARPNSSLGMAEAEFLRRMNGALPAGIPDWFYTRRIKQILAHDALSARPRGARLLLPSGREAWAAEQAGLLVAGLRDAKYHVVGDLGELVPRPAAGAYLAPAAQPAEQLLDAAVHAAAALADHYYRQLYPARQQRQPWGGPRQLARQLLWTMLNGSWLRGVLRSISHRRAVRRLRIVLWRVLIRPGRHRR